jgi:S-adenosylmethionine-diacylglycerol 3-amino-3-carboxypropyl transferase
MSFFQKLNFSSSNEDGETELAALAGSKRILCLTGSGTRSLDMLLSDAQEVISFDVNPTQNALLQLKIAAIQTLEYEDFLSFLGIGSRRVNSLYQSLVREKLSPEMRAYWDQNQKLLESGVWYQGKWEKLLGWNARLLNFFRGQAIHAVMTASSVQEQGAIWQQRFNDSRLRSTIEMISRRWVWAWIMREPAGNFLPSSSTVGEKLANCFAHASKSYLFRESDFATLILKGKLQVGGAMPVHLRSENYELIRQRLPRLRVVQGGLAELNSSSILGVDGFSLSDFGSYCGPDVYAQCWRGIMSVAAPKAKFCERIFMNDMPLPFNDIQEDHDLSSRLTNSDKAIIYKIRAGRIANKNASTFGAPD